MSARRRACKQNEEGAHTRKSPEVERKVSHEQVVRTAKVKPLPNLRMK